MSVERVVAPVPRDREALSHGEARAVGHAEKRRQPRIARPLQARYGRHGVELKEANVVVLDALPEGDLQLAPGPVDEGAGTGHLVEREVALEIADVDGVSLRAHERPEADLREAVLKVIRRARRSCDLLVVGLDLGVEDEKVRQVRGLHAKGEPIASPKMFAVAVLERPAHALARREPRADLDVLRRPLDEVDDDVLVRLRHVRVARGATWMLEKTPRVAMRSCVLRTSLAR